MIINKIKTCIFLLALTIFFGCKGGTSLSNITKASCTLNGQTITDGASTTAYSSATVAYGQTCASETRTCSDGTLSGSYTYASCTVGPSGACIFNGQSIASGATTTGYFTATVPFGQICSSETRTCTSGTLSGTYAFASCSVNPAGACTFNGQTVVHTGTTTAYSTATVPYGQTCTSETRTCTNGTLSGSYGYASCSVNPLTPPASCASPTTTVIDRGEKTSSAATQRGLWSDTKIIPGSQWAATAYYDGSATGGTASIKISFWDGLKYTVENVTTDAFVAAGSATWVKLAFLSTGKPIIVWTTGGTTIKAAMRSAALGSTGTWTATVLETTTGAATRSASIAVSPNDDVGIAYLTNTTTAGRVRFLLCTACTSVLNFSAMTTADTIDNTATIVAFGSITTAWCNNSGTYVPVVAYPITGFLSYAYCTGAASSLGWNSCISASNWTKTNIVAAAAPVHVEMKVAASANGLVDILAKTASGNAMTVYKSTAGCTAPTSFTANANVVGATTAGTAWASFIVDGSGKYHVVANDSTTSMVYMNSATSNLATTTWNSAGTIDTVTLPAVGAGGGGADISSNGMIFSSYGLNAATYNLNIGIVNDSTIASNSASSVYYTSIPDTSGAINVPLTGGNQERNVSTAATSTGTPGIAYVNHSIGTLAASTLSYAYRDGTTATSIWRHYHVPITTNPLFPSLAYDENNHPWISYYDSGTFRYYLATNTLTDGSGTWSIYQVPLGAKTASAVVPATDDTSLAMYYSGGVAYPVMIFMNSTAAGGTGLKAIRLNPTTGLFGAMVTVDALGASWGTRLASDFDTSGNIVVAFYDITSTAVKFSYSANGGSTWSSTAQLTTSGVGREGLSIKINPSTSKPAVSYYDKTNNKVFYNACYTALASCSNAGNWTQTLAQGSTSVAVSGIAAPANEQVLNTSLSFSAAGVPYIAYMTGHLSTGLNASLALTDSTTGFSPTAPVLLVTSPTTTGSSAMSFGQPGMSVSSVRNSLGQFISAHVGPNNWLYATSCGD